jgi:dinuclear metal center YbgI/SA1388 family protein
LEEARAKGCNLVVTHHPIWFSGRKRLNGEDYVSRIIMYAVKHDIGLLACHTNLDNIRQGVNQKIAEKLGLTDTFFLQPKAGDMPYGSGMVGFLPTLMPKTAFLQAVKTAFQCGGIRYADAPAIEFVHKVAVCGGSGSFLTAQAIAAGCDAFITADITYHKYFDNEEKILLLDIGHYESEQYTSDLICAYLSEKIPTFAPYLSQIRTNPVQYF